MSSYESCLHSNARVGYIYVYTGITELMGICDFVLYDLVDADKELSSVYTSREF